MVKLPRLKDENEAFSEKAETAFRELFELAKAKNELHFAMGLMPEFRGMADPGWSTAQETQFAFREYLKFLENLEPSRMKARIALGFYCHLAEASGLYEVPKNMLRISEGKSHVLWPFKDLVQEHVQTGNLMAPNANKVLRDLTGHAKTLGLDNLAEIFRDAFEPDIRNGYAHADFVIWDDGLRLPKRNGGNARSIPWADFQSLFERGISFFNIIQEVVGEFVRSYNPPKTIKARLQDEPEDDWTIYFDPIKGNFGLTTGKYKQSEIKKP